MILPYDLDPLLDWDTLPHSVLLTLLRYCGIGSWLVRILMTSTDSPLVLGLPFFEEELLGNVYGIGMLNILFLAAKVVGNPIH